MRKFMIVSALLLVVFNAHASDIKGTIHEAISKEKDQCTSSVLSLMAAGQEASAKDLAKQEGCVSAIKPGTESVSNIRVSSKDKGVFCADINAESPLGIKITHKSVVQNGNVFHGDIEHTDGEGPRIALNKMARALNSRFCE